MKHMNFSFVEPGLVAGSAHPARFGSMEGLQFLVNSGIQAIVSLDEFGLDSALLGEMGLIHLHSPITDFSVPTPAQAKQVVEFIEDCLSQARPVVVHCAAGIGRTGTMLACWFVHRGMDAPTAIAHIRRLRPGSIETSEQEDFVHRFAARIR